MSEPTASQETRPYYGRRALVFGLARSGRAAAELLLRSGAAVEVVDEGTPRPEDLAWLSANALVLQRQPVPELLEKVDLFVLSPGIPRRHDFVRMALDRRVEVISEIELAYRCSEAPLVAVTGSKGKSTTVALVGHLLQAAGVANVVAGNIGRPYSQVVPQLKRDTWVILELSSFQLESILTFRPDIAVQLHLSADHLDRYPDMQNYAAAKAHIVDNQRPQDVLIVDPDHEYSHALLQRSPARRVGYGNLAAGTGVRLEGQHFVWRAPGERRELAHLDEISLVGKHNRFNVMAALAVCVTMDAWTVHSSKALQTFRGLPYRMQSLGVIAGVHFINDGKSTTVEAVRAALQGLEMPVMLALGGRNKGLDFAALRPALAGVRCVFVFGEDQNAIAAALQGAARLERVADLDELVARARQMGRPGEALLFSPGCTSFDMFENAEARGRAFERAVEHLREVDGG